MPYIIFIRHAQKKYRNNKGPKGLPRHDPSLKEGMDKEILSKVSEYFDKYGPANKIYTSPFLRTRQTAQIIKDDLSTNAMLIVDKQLEEYLGFQKAFGQKADLDQETSKYTDIRLGIENIHQLEKRAYNFYENIKSSKENILIITHGFFITRLAKKLDFNINYINELEGIIIQKNNIKKL